MDQSKKNVRKGSMSISAARAHDSYFRNKKKANEIQQLGGFMPLRSSQIKYKTLQDRTEEIHTVEEYSADDKFVICVKREGEREKHYIIKNNKDKIELEENQMKMLCDFWLEMQSLLSKKTPPPSPRIYENNRVPILFVDNGKDLFDHPRTPKNSISE